jgi:hypothetical protein
MNPTKIGARITKAREWQGAYPRNLLDETCERHQRRRQACIAVVIIVVGITTLIIGLVAS